MSCKCDSFKNSLKWDTGSHSWLWLLTSVWKRSCMDQYILPFYLNQMSRSLKHREHKLSVCPPWHHSTRVWKSTAALCVCSGVSFISAVSSALQPSCGKSRLRKHPNIPDNTLIDPFFFLYFSLLKVICADLWAGRISMHANKSRLSRVYAILQSAFREETH